MFAEEGPANYRWGEVVSLAVHGGEHEVHAEGSANLSEPRQYMGVSTGSSANYRCGDVSLNPASPPVHGEKNLCMVLIVLRKHV